MSKINKVIKAETHCFGFFNIWDAMGISFKVQKRLNKFSVLYKDNTTLQLEEWQRKK